MCVCLSTRSGSMRVNVPRSLEVTFGGILKIALVSGQKGKPPSHVFWQGVSRYF